MSGQGTAVRNVQQEKGSRFFWGGCKGPAVFVGLCIGDTGGELLETKNLTTLSGRNS
jgi:hypothetical protein